MSAVNVKFALTAQLVDSLADVPASATEVQVRAGIEYDDFLISADTGLGQSKDFILAKLVPYDLRATLQTCAEVTAVLGIDLYPNYAPFDGQTTPLTAEDTLVQFEKVRFPYGGVFRLCYNPGTGWEELAPKITVYGAEPLPPGLNFWCSLANLEASQCADPTIDSCQCRGKLEGTGLGVNPTFPDSRLILTNYEDTCGEGAIVSPFANDLAVPSYFEGYEVANFGTRDPGTQLNVWKLCYCVSYDADMADSDTDGTIDGICSPISIADFPQFVGYLTTIRALPMEGTSIITVYPTLRFNLVFQCGSDGNNGPGGCSTTGESRYRLVRRNTAADLPYYDGDGGCQYLPQAETYTDGAKIHGGQIAPTNCVGSAVQCLDEPEVNGPKLPTFNSLQLAPSFQNNQMMSSEFDICYCDRNCLNSQYWFKAGNVIVYSVSTFFSIDGNARAAPSVNKEYYIVVRGDGKTSAGLTAPGSWSSEIDGSTTRELKILRDDDAGNIDSEACLNTEQPTELSGHQLISGNTDYTDPETIFNIDNKPIEQRYGKICSATTCERNIKLARSGWYALCYCDSNCNEAPNWAVYGRDLVAGPLGEQIWTKYTGVTFDITVKGYALSTSNQIMVLSYTDLPAFCGIRTKSNRVYGPQAGAPTMLDINTPPGAGIADMNYHASGTEITFNKRHYLSDGDQIQLTGVVAATTNINNMYNTWHRVFVLCDNDPIDTLSSACYKIVIPVEFVAAEFQKPEFAAAKWFRTSEQTFSGLRIKHDNPTPEGRGYVVCWSAVDQFTDPDAEEKDFVGPVGIIQAKNPLEMPEAFIGLTTVEVSPETNGARGAPVLLVFTTGDISAYGDSSKQMQLVISFQPEEENGNQELSVTPKTRYLTDVSDDPTFDEVHEADQAFCGRLILELWSADPDGFPMPDGCYYRVDKSSGNTVNEAKENVPEIHIVFSRGNNLKKNTQYMIVLNMEVTTAYRDSKFPIFLFSMDDIHDSPDGVVELGRMVPSPDYRVPPRDEDQNLLDWNFGDPDWDGSEGFLVSTDDSTSVKELQSFCIGHLPAFPTTTPDLQRACTPCASEADCGNYDKSLVWCQSPIDPRCLEFGETITDGNYFSFAFTLKPKLQCPIKKSSVLRVFLQPFTQWNIGPQCQVVFAGCPPPPSGQPCGSPACQSEALVGGTPEISSDYPFNTLKISMPAQMGDITFSGPATMKVGSLSIPAGGFLPQAVMAEIMKEGDVSPRSFNPVMMNLVKLYKTPRIIAASLVTAADPLVNNNPFRGDDDNQLYVRLVSGATLFAYQTGSVDMMFTLPPGYMCSQSLAGQPVPDLLIFADKNPSTKGKFGGDQNREIKFSNPVNPIGCQLAFQLEMIMYANTVVYFQLNVNNPDVYMKQDDEDNVWQMQVKITSPLNIQLDWYTLSSDTLSPCPAPSEKIFCTSDLGSNFGGSVSVLGKLVDVIIQPTVFGASALNELLVFFTTEQTVGTLTASESEVWVDAPSTYNFGQYCAASHLAETYYIPEGRGTNPLPSGDVIICQGDVAAVGELTYNRARVRTTGRLLTQTAYGFSVKVYNTPYFVRTQLDEWRVWTYTASGIAVDGAYETARFNENDDLGADMSWGIYRLSMPASNFAVAISDLRPSADGSNTEIIVLPIIVQVPMYKSVRILAPAGYVWDFQQQDFRYKAAGFGVQAALVVEGAEADLPINYPPNSPQNEPFNMIVMDAIQTSWTPGVKYGFTAKIRLPRVPPTGSANYFYIEFGYDETENLNRLEAGITAGPQIQTLINGALSFTSSILGAATKITFSVQTVSHIPEGGALMISGPANFQFQGPLCQPKPAPGFREMPYDSTCLYEELAATGEPQVTIVAGASGIPPGFYRFTLDSVNPPLVLPEGSAGEWVIQTFSLVSERSPLDFNTTIASYPVGRPMLDAGLVMHPKVPCSFLSALQQAIDPTIPISDCDFEFWQFYEPRGFRDDRPGRPSQLIIFFKLEETPTTPQELVVRLPEGYIFDIECKVVFNLNKTFDDSWIADDIMSADLSKDAITNNPVDLGYAQDKTAVADRFTPWPAQATMDYCKGSGNVARMLINPGLKTGNVNVDENFAVNPYVFRISVAANPNVHPTDNKFVLEYNSESSAMFEGVSIWTFRDTAVESQTTAASTEALPIENVVTIYLRPVNNLPNGGHMIVNAPSGFSFPTACDTSVRLAPEDQPDMTAVDDAVDALRWSDFQEGDILCQGDTTPSKRAKIFFPFVTGGLGKRLEKGKMYMLTMGVRNPRTTTAEPDNWHVYSYADTSTNDLIDSAVITGFPINSAVPAFAYLFPSSMNANVEQVLTFNISFPKAVSFGDVIQVIAPTTFYFGKLGDATCPQYAHLSGALSLTKPVCAANSMTWTLLQESVPAFAPAVFVVQLRNPARTPELNHFQVRHRQPDGERVSSRIIDGYPIIPELSKLTVTEQVPETVCRAEADAITGQFCQGASSTSAVSVRFTPTQTAELVKISGHVDGETFDFSGASFAPGITVYARSHDAIVCAPSDGFIGGQDFILPIVNLRNPAVDGVSMWSAVTYTTRIATTTPEPVAECGATGVCGWFPLFGSRVDASLQKPMFDVYGYINVLESSRIFPIYLAETSATVTFDIRAQFAIPAHNVLRITRPIGYSFLENTQVIVSPSAPTLEFSEYGIDWDLKWSSDWNDPQDMYMVFGKALAADAVMLFSFQCALPNAPQSTTFWFFRTYAVLPIVDYDGEILDDSVQPYPWSGRGLKITGTNDGAFPGFILVGQLPFAVVTSIQTPFANVILTVNLDISDRIDAGIGGTIVITVEAPLGYQFESQCLENGYSAFKKCIGQSTLAELTAQSRILEGSNTVVELRVINPKFTPEVNEWTAKLYTNGGVQYERYSVAPGYTIVTMPVSYKGNNQLGEAAPGFFTFVPIRSNPTPELYVVVTPPPDQGYNILCTGIEPLGFLVMPNCVAGGMNQPMQLKWDNVSIMAGSSYTFGVLIYNPGGAPEASKNLFGVSLQYETGGVPQAFDANMQVPGLKLKSLPLRFKGVGWTDSTPQVLATVLLQIEVLYDIPAGYASRIMIRAPAGIMYNEDTSTFKVTPEPLPQKEALPVEIAGDAMYLNLDDTKVVAAKTYNILFEVSNPGKYPSDNTWSLTVYKDISVEFTHVAASYVDGQESPIDITGVLKSGASRLRSAVGSAWLVVCLPTLVVAGC
jgi:hypothetical protein